jgi:hypothetical protein
MFEGQQNQREAQLRYVRVIMDQVAAVDSRVEGYRKALRDTVTDILQLEMANVQKRTNITQKVGAKVESLGSFLVANGWNDAEGPKS